MKRKMRNYTKIIVVILMVIIIFVTNKYKSKLYVTGFVRDIFYYSSSYIKDKDDVINVNLNKELVAEINTLKDTLKLNSTLIDFDIVNATVINRSYLDWFSALVINKGRNNSLKEGMAVVSNTGLVGVLENVSYNTSTVKLITSREYKNKISVKINDKFKILEMDKEGNLIIRGIEEKDNIKEMDEVVTSGLSQLFPAGIVIGSITKLEDDYYNISKKAIISVKENLNNITFVSVLRRSVDNE